MKRYLVLAPKPEESEQFYIVAERLKLKDGTFAKHGIKEALCSCYNENHANSIAYALNYTMP